MDENVQQKDAINQNSSGEIFWTGGVPLNGIASEIGLSEERFKKALS